MLLFMEKKINFIYYQRLNGHVEFQKYLDGLSTKNAAKFLSVIQRVEEIGILDAIKIKDVKKIDKYIYELRARFDKTQMRGLYFHFEGKQYFITHGFTKRGSANAFKRNNSCSCIAARVYRKAEAK